MGKQEIKDEFKNMDGDPQVKGRIRRIQMEMSQKRMMANVPDADVVITNPTHYAIAMKYDKSVDSAPTIVAKGIDFIAIKIGRDFFPSLRSFPTGFLVIFGSPITPIRSSVI